VLREAQLRYLRWAITAVTVGDPGPLPDVDPQLAPSALLHAGLTAFVAGHLRASGEEAPAELSEHLAEQGEAVAERTRRFRVQLPKVLATLGASGVSAIPVKGLALGDAVWPRPGERPMADIDLLIDPARRAHATQAMTGAGYRLVEQAPNEDTFLAWGDGSVGRTDGESADHNGKVELHPGWVERAHGYSVDDRGVLRAASLPGEIGGVECRVLPPAALALHTLGHLSISVIRRDVRALNVLDVVLALRSLDASDRAEFDRLAALVDPRFVAPGWWLALAVSPGSLHGSPAPTELIGERARRELAVTSPIDVLRAEGARSRWAWRAAWAATRSEQWAMFRQFVWPPANELRRGATDRSLVRLHLDRVLRGWRRVRVSPALVKRTRSQHHG
jgi:Uncharacterised nucleotidyltransferase